MLIFYFGLQIYTFIGVFSFLAVLILSIIYLVFLGIKKCFKNIKELSIQTSIREA